MSVLAWRCSLNSFSNAAFRLRNSLKGSRVSPLRSGMAPGLLRQSAHSASLMKQHRDEELDLPFVANDMNDSLGTMDKPLDTVDAPGRADSELAEEGLPPRNPDLAPSPQRGLRRSSS